jgi:Sulfotransferase domain
MIVSSITTVQSIIKTPLCLAFLAIFIIGFSSQSSSLLSLLFSDNARYETVVPSPRTFIPLHNDNVTSDDGDGDAEADFGNRANPIPMNIWPQLDNLTCIEQGLSTYPLPGDTNEWQIRAPYALILGAMKAGTTALGEFLWRHPAVVQTSRKELHFFDFRFTPFTSDQGIQRANARKEYRNVFFRCGAGHTVANNNTLIAIDNSPKYLFLSDLVPARVMCVTPWVKIIVILRNPIDRAYSHFHMKNSDTWRQTNANITFEEWIQKDLNDMKQVGLLQNDIPFSEFRGSDQEWTAWKAYTRLGTHSPIGRGLYVIQLRHWFQTWEAFGKSRNDFLVLHSQDLRDNTALVYQHLLDFLHLPAFPLSHAEETMKANYSKPISAITRQKLIDFYSPYNQELYELLGNTWDGIWDN